MTNRSAGRIFVFGLGYTATRLAHRLAAAGWHVAGTCRSGDKRERLAGLGGHVHLFNRDRPLDASGIATLGAASHILSSVPPDEAGDPVIDAHGDEIARSGAGWIGFLSSTSVYGDRGGDWVDEDSEPLPSTDRGRRRLAAEGAWLTLWREAGRPVHVFRLAGIYGPSRSALDAIRRGRARRVIKPGQVFSRIHVEDAVTALIASMARPRPGAVYNLADDLPAPSEAVIEHASALLGVAPPAAVAFAEADLPPTGRDFYADCRRVRNDRIKRELGVTLAAPDFRTGLASILAGEPVG
jgi:nucleoside-diphosphate-sugar epimerase